MSEIVYKQGCEHIDWVGLRQSLIEDDFHNGRSVEQYRASFCNSAVVITAYDGTRLIGTVRALSDGVCNAYIVDVWTHSDYRYRGIATQMMQRAEAELRGQHMYLFTDDALGFYKTLGFVQQDTGMGKVSGEWLRPSPNL